MSDQQSLPFWKKLPNLVFNRLNGRSSGSSDQGDKPDEHKPLNVFHQEYDINKLDPPMHRVLVLQALVYRERIEALVGEYPLASGREVLIPIAGQVEACVSGLYRLALSLETVSPATVTALTSEHSDEHTDVTAAPDPAPAQETALKDSLAELDPPDRPTVRLTIPDLLSHAAAEQQFEDTLTALGTAYSLMLLLDGKEVDESRAQHLHDLLSRQVALLAAPALSPNTSGTPT